MPNQMGPDGFSRSLPEHERIAIALVSVLDTEAGKKVMDYLRSVTIKRVNGSAVTPEQLMHHEGQRYIVAVMEQWIQLGHQAKEKE